MKTTRRLLTLLLALALMLSLAVTVSAQENEDHAPFLSYRWLNNEEDGWYQVMDEDPSMGEDGTLALTWVWRIYYLNTWDEDAGAYVSQPVIPSEDHPDLTIEKVVDLGEEEHIREGEENADYFVKVTALNSMDYQETELYYMNGGEKLSLPFFIYEFWSGFYTSQEVSLDTVIVNGNFGTDPLAEENAFYYIEHDESWNVDSLIYHAVTWDEEGNEVEDNTLVSMTEIGNGVYKFTVDPDFVTMTTANWRNFNLRLEVMLSDDEGNTTEDWRDIWVNPSGSHDNVAARFSINGAEYMFYEDSDVIGTWEPQLDENGDPLMNDWGDHIHYWTKTELPEGVSYNVGSNTLTLNNARLQTLNADYHWANRDENGDIIQREDGTLEEGWNLPNANLKINLKGQNEIVCGYDVPVNIDGELNLTINGTGSLWVVAVNSTENTRTEYHWDGENEVEMEVYNHFDAIHVNNGSNLTIAGNAKVTAEIQGEGYETIYDENGPTDRYENAYLSAVRVNEGELTLKDNASLTTVLPEDARDNGPAIDGYYSGGYRGLEYFRSLTVQDKATLNTSTLYISNGWQWNEETQEDEISWTGTYNQTGGTVNITALGSYGVNQNDDGELIPHFHYNGLRTDFGEINISGGILNVEAEPKFEAELEGSIWMEAINPGEGQLNISGGTVNAETAIGCALAIPSGDVTVSGGEVNLATHDGTVLALGDWGHDPENGFIADGKLTVTGGEMNLEFAGEYLGAAVEIDPSSRESSISGGAMNVENGCFDIFGGFAINGGEVNIEATAADPGWIAFGTCDMDAELTVTGGKLNIDTTNCYAAMLNDGTFCQTGGEIVLHAASEAAWRGEYPDMDISGLVSAGRTEFSGGTFTVEAENIGIVQELGHHVYLDDDGNPIVDVMEDQGIFVKDDAVVDLTAGNFGMFLRTPVEISGGQVHATATSEDTFAIGTRLSSSAYEDEYVTEEGDRIPFSVDNYARLSITGGSHSFTAPTNSESHAGLMIVDSPANIENATVEVIGSRGLLEARLADDGSALTGSYYIVSLKNGEEMERFAQSVVDESGDEPVTVHLHLFTEDNKAPAEGAEELNYATELLLLPDDQCGEKAYWEIEDGVLTISGEGAMFDYEPDFANERATTPWTPVKHAIKEIVVEEGITAVGAWSFAWLDSVTHISYPASLQEIRPASTTRTDKLAGYTVASGNKRYASPDGISIVDTKESTLITVAQAAPGKTYTVPKNVKVIESGALRLCGFEDVVIPEGVTELRPAVFEGCTSLKTVTIPESVTKLGEAMFAGCGNVTVTVYCDTAGADYVEANEINSTVLHEFVDATCTAPKTCERCGSTEGKALGHKWSEWETGTDGVKTRTCSVCKETETDKPSKPHVSNCPKDDTCPLSAYVDLNAGDWYHEGIHYCIDEGLMNGMSANTFEAGGFTTRAQLVTILYRAEGQPDIAGLSEPFSDVSEADWYYKSIVWAYNNQVVNGMTADTFAPNGNVTREQVATILYRYTGSPAVSGSLANFPDKANVSSYAETPLLWATGEGLINGVMQPDGTSLLDPTGNATRAQIATILMRYLANG